MRCRLDCQRGDWLLLAIAAVAVELGSVHSKLSECLQSVSRSSDEIGFHAQTHDFQQPKTLHLSIVTLIENQYFYTTLLEKQYYLKRFSNALLGYKLPALEQS